MFGLSLRLSAVGVEAKASMRTRALAVAADKWNGNVGQQRR